MSIRDWLGRSALAGLCLTSATWAADPAFVPPPQGLGLAQLVDLAWARSAEAGGVEAQRALLAARDLAAASLFPGPPSVGLDLRQGLPASLAPAGTGRASTSGLMEIDTGVAAPLWLPGQQRATAAVLAAERARLEAQLRRQRWQLAGELREAVWALDQAQTQFTVQTDRLELAEKLEADVVRRVQAGERAPVDQMLAAADRAQAQSALQEAQLQALGAASRLARLSGVDAMGPIAESPALAADVDTHPALVAARAALALATARLEAVRATPRDAPTVSVVARLERDALSGDARNSVRMGVSVPLDTEARQAPRLAAALSEQVDAELAWARERRLLEVEQSQARQVLEATEGLLERAEERLTLARAAQQALERAFAAGERGLPEVLRARQATLDAQLAVASARSTRGRAIARYNQSLGVEP